MELWTIVAGVVIGCICSAGVWAIRDLRDARKTIERLQAENDELNAKLAFPRVARPAPEPAEEVKNTRALPRPGRFQSFAAEKRRIENAEVENRRA